MIKSPHGLQRAGRYAGRLWGENRRRKQSRQKILQQLGKGGSDGERQEVLREIKQREKSVLVKKRGKKVE